jgi:hypothetical protein
MRKVLKWTVLGGLLITLAAPAWATVTVNQVMLSPQILLQIYRAYQSHLNNIDWNNPNIIQLLAAADAASAGKNLTFRVEIYAGSIWVATVGDFKALSRVLALGPNQFNANDIGAVNLNVQFNPNYTPDANNLTQGSILPSSSFIVKIVPVDLTPGQPFVMQFELFTPRSALNQPPIPIYPKGVEVNTPLPQFSWTSVPNAAYYVLSVGPNQDTNVNTYWTSGHLTLAQAMYPPDARALENGQMYYWQVKAVDTFGNPVGGVDGRSQAADFTVNSSAHATTAVSPADAEAALKIAIKDPAVFDKLTGYQAVAIETTADDLAGLLQQLRDGTATVTAAGVE